MVQGKTMKSKRVEHFKPNFIEALLILIPLIFLYLFITFGITFDALYQELLKLKEE